MEPTAPGLETAVQALVERILTLYESGLTLEEIVERIFTTDTETAAFRMEALIQIVIGDRYFATDRGCGAQP